MFVKPFLFLYFFRTNVYQVKLDNISFLFKFIFKKLNCKKNLKDTCQN